ncbi:MAG: molybdopterin-dependent oxidoreductase, partial [bacterium]|nr:molybdopterin-dependent oxidoreductase [bacterium]
RFSKTAAKAWKWLPIKPGEEGALAMAFIRYIIENEKYDKNYLSAANKAAAVNIKEPTWTNATWLVKVEEKGYGKFLRAHEVGLGPPDKRKTKDAKEYDYEYFVAFKDGMPIKVDPNDDKNPVYGDLFIDTVINGIRVKSVMQILKEEAFKYSFEKWCEIAGLDSSDVLEVVKEFVKHGKKSVCDLHRGVSQHTNGYYNAVAWWCVNLLMGNFYHVGGMSSPSSWNIDGSKSEHQPYDLKKMHPNKLTPFGISIIRHGIKYEETTIFRGYPSKRPFYPVSSDVYQEIIPSIGDAYPYSIGCLILYMGTPVYALPCGDRLIPILLDTKKFPLFISIDITVGETSMYADYIIPDLSYLERWEFHGSHPSFINKIQPIRNPAIAPLTETVKVFGVDMPLGLESFLMALAEKLNLSGFGRNGFAEGIHFLHYDDFYLKMVANVAAGEKPEQVLNDANPYEIKVFLEARKHLPKSVFDPERWKKAAGLHWWPKVVYLLNRGGRYEDFEKGYKESQLSNQKNILINIYSEKVATTKSSITGKYFKGYPAYIPAPLDLDDRKINEEGLHLITHREITMTKSRTISNYYLLNIMPENFLIINPIDALKYKVNDGDYVKVVSSSNSGEWDLGNGSKLPLIIKVKISEGIRPGVCSFALGYGHFAYGSRDIYIDGVKIPADVKRAKGAHLNPLMQISPFLKNTALSDPVGASVSFYDSKVKIIKI